MTLVESIPTNLTYPSGSPQHMSTFDAWNTIMNRAKHSLDIASYYWVLRGFGNNSGPTDDEGLMIFDKIVNTSSRGVKVRIVQNDPTSSNYGNDTVKLAELGVAVQSINFTALLGAGILHTKLWIADGLHFYVGSANTDWRALTEVKELGLLVTDCPCLAKDVEKIFDVYWQLSVPGTPSIPDKWPTNVSTTLNLNNPARLRVNKTDANVYLASSPGELCPTGRTVDIDALLYVINSAQQFVYIAVMDYFPALIYTHPQVYWPVIDDALRSAVFNKGITVRFMGSLWNHTGPDMIKFLRSLQSINDTGQFNGVKGVLEVKLFQVPPVQPVVPYTRVNHNKYMVTDNAAYIGTSNWSGDYFVSTGGVSCIVNQTGVASDVSTIQRQLMEVFDRDWNSQYANFV
ncbi:5'-3' exonuclease PLD3-like isoform X2 [Dysidea avara]